MHVRTAGWAGLCLLFSFGISAQQGAKPNRKALLIVNSRYQKLTPLDSPRLDEAVLKAALLKTGFDVSTIADDGAVALGGHYSDFLKKVAAGDCVLVFFSGYAVQFRTPQGETEDYLLPVDFDPQSTLSMPSRALPLSRILGNLERLKASVKIVLVDASREEEHLSQFGPGLASPDLEDSTDTATILSAPPNQTRPNPQAGSPGELAKVFSEAMLRQGSTVSDAMLKAREQIGAFPLIQPLPHAFYFTDPPPPPPPPKPIVITRDNFTEVPQVNTKDRQEYVFIKKGSFLMGCVPSDKKDQCDAGEKPQHEVRLPKDFWMGQTEVTIDRYNRFIDLAKTVKKPPKPNWWKEQTGNHPIVLVTWEDAQKFCNWAGGRLPTEAEWEYAARAGKANQTYPYDSLENSRDKANFSQTQGNDRYVFTAPVKSFDANAWNLFDMSGNVWEWTQDWFSPNYYQESPKEDPQGPASGSKRVYRGGSFSSDPSKHLRISYRGADRPDKKGSADNVGFRCVLPDNDATRKLLGAK